MVQSLRITFMCLESPNVRLIIRVQVDLYGMLLYQQLSSSPYTPRPARHQQNVQADRPNDENNCRLSARKSSRESSVESCISDNEDDRVGCDKSKSMCNKSRWTMTGLPKVVPR